MRWDATPIAARPAPLPALPGLLYCPATPRTARTHGKIIFFLFPGQDLSIFKNLEIAGSRVDSVSQERLASRQNIGHSPRSASYPIGLFILGQLIDGIALDFTYPSVCSSVCVVDIGRSAAIERKPGYAAYGAAWACLFRADSDYIGTRPAHGRRRRSRGCPRNSFRIAPRIDSRFARPCRC